MLHCADGDIDTIQPPFIAFIHEYTHDLKCNVLDEHILPYGRTGWEEFLSGYRSYNGNLALTGLIGCVQ